MAGLVPELERFLFFVLKNTLKKKAKHLGREFFARFSIKKKLTDLKKQLHPI